MRMYIVAFISFHDNVLHQVKCFSMSEIDACVDGLLVLGQLNDVDVSSYRLLSLERLKNELFDMDATISVIPV